MSGEHPLFSAVLEAASGAGIQTVPLETAESPEWWGSIAKVCQKILLARAQGTQAVLPTSQAGLSKTMEAGRESAAS